jgi:hypothetical protein
MDEDRIEAEAPGLSAAAEDCARSTPQRGAPPGRCRAG